MQYYIMLILMQLLNEFFFSYTVFYTITFSFNERLSKMRRS